MSRKQVRIPYGHRHLAEIRSARIISNTKSIATDGIARFKWCAFGITVPQHDIDLVDYVVVHVINVI